jgi:hypothetical protein
MLIGMGSFSDPWRGDLDEVRVWNVGRSEGEIQATMGVPLIGDEPGLVGYWRFDGGPASFALDSSSNGNHGILGALPVPDPADPEWTASTAPVLDLYEASPPFGPFYGSTTVTLSGSGFTPGATVSVGGQPATSVLFVSPSSLVADFPSGPLGAADVVVTTAAGSVALPSGWEWVDHLHATSLSISTSSPAPVDLALFATPANAGLLYLVATTTSGTTPGLPLPPSPFVLPLNPDAWTVLGLLSANSALFANFAGALDAAGAATATFDPGTSPLDPVLAGVSISFAYVVFSAPPSTSFVFVSNPVTTTVFP